ncbi:MAG: disulfide bond formation protein B [bacterium]|nr:disulfide bond formation protein B [bacterium]
MSPLTSAVNQALSLLTLGSQFLIVALFILCLLSVSARKKIFSFAGKKATFFSFIIALVATLGSLFYSEIAGFEPCKLCWFERILMYPESIIFGIALWRKRDASDYGIALSLIGIFISGYHYILQIGIIPATSCSVVGYSVSCSKVFSMSFGYITIPMIAFTAFLLILLLQILKKKVQKANS